MTTAHHVWVCIVIVVIHFLICLNLIRPEINSNVILVVIVELDLTFVFVIKFDIMDRDKF